MFSESLALLARREVIAHRSVAGAGCVGVAVNGEINVGLLIVGVGGTLVERDLHFDRRHIDHAEIFLLQDLFQRFAHAVHLNALGRGTRGIFVASLAGGRKIDDRHAAVFEAAGGDSDKFVCYRGLFAGDPCVLSLPAEPEPCHVAGITAPFEGGVFCSRVHRAQHAVACSRAAVDLGAVALDFEGALDVALIALFSDHGKCGVAVGGLSRLVRNTAENLHHMPCAVGDTSRRGGGSVLPERPILLARLLVIPLIGQTASLRLDSESGGLTGMNRHLRGLRGYLDGGNHRKRRGGRIDPGAGFVAHPAVNLHAVHRLFRLNRQLLRRLGVPERPRGVALHAAVPLIAVFAHSPRGHGKVNASARRDGFAQRMGHNGKRLIHLDKRGQGFDRSVLFICYPAADLHKVPGGIGDR